MDAVTGYKNLLVSVFGDPMLAKTELSPEIQVGLIKICDGLINGLKINYRAPDIIHRRFGIKTEPETLKSIADSYNICKERVRQIEKQALRCLKHPARSRILGKFLSEEVGLQNPTLQPIKITKYDNFRKQVQSGDALTESELSEIPLWELNMSVRSHIALRNDGVVMLTDLLCRHKTDLLNLPNFGKKSLAELREAVSQFGVAIPD